MGGRKRREGEEEGEEKEEGSEMIARANDEKLRFKKKNE